MDEINVKRVLEDDVLIVSDLREVKNLPKARATYNTIVYCRSGNILVEIDGNRQAKVLSGQLLLIPAGKTVQPIQVDTNVEARALLISERMLKTVLDRQMAVWHRAIYMQEIYVVENAEWFDGMESYTRFIFTENMQRHFLYREIVESFFRTMLLLVCEELIRYESLEETGGADGRTGDGAPGTASPHDKEIFNKFLQLLLTEEQKRQRVSLYADRLNITSKYLSGVCKRVSGKSPLRWITDSVMQDCYRLLTETDLSIKEISNNLGFPNPSFFGQYFREQAGATPMEFRTKRKRVI